MEGQLAVGTFHACRIDGAGLTQCWGTTNRAVIGDGEAGDSTLGDKTSPAAVFHGPWSAVSAGRLTSRGLTPGGSAFRWGNNSNGQLGDGNATDHPVPTRVQSNETFVAIGTGGAFTCAMTPDRRVFRWGSNAEGEFGSGSAGGSSALPVLVP